MQKTKQNKKQKQRKVDPQIPITTFWAVWFVLAG